MANAGDCRAGKPTSAQGAVAKSRSPRSNGVEPHLPRHWPGFQATIRTEGGVLEINVENVREAGEDATELLVDGSPIAGNRVDVPGEGATLRVTLRPKPAGENA